MNATPSPSSALFAGQRALITGGTQGIGKAVAMRLARQGAHVYLNFSRNLAAAEEAIAAFRAAGHSAQLAQADLSDPAAIDAMLQSIAADGPLDILVCNAAYQEKVPFLDTSLALMQQTFAVNVFGNVHIVQSVGKRMVELGAKGRIVVCTSPHGTYVYNESFAYDISKAALNHMVRGAALALIAHGIRVNAVDIGW
ncbi:MAG: SDR family oxidoreductase, partial [Phycisphaeraceae bacterium]